MHEWLVQAASTLGIRGSTIVTAAEGNDRSGRRHSIRSEVEFGTAGSGERVALR